MTSIGAAAAQEKKTWTFDAEVGGIPGLKSASIDVKKVGDWGAVTHQYTYDLAVIEEIGQVGASLQIELPDSVAEQADKRQLSVDPAEVDRVTVTVEPRTRTAQDYGGADGPTPVNQWNLKAWAETNSLACGTLAESEIPIDRQFSGPGFTPYFENSTLLAEGGDSACFTEWHVDSTDHGHSNSHITGEAFFFNEDFQIGTVYSDHTYDLIAGGSYGINVNNYGAWTYIFVDPRSDTGVDSI
ncbi:hypothetical protein [Halovivax gelatinilyticus]|uniref:hypothetical protein n=1 Tax=Halovivax gelatinilyticus TaxID=2961597 RepID=UPI0020CA3C93|nr:hypothetical protein [Halovivax gelatinilyticus]